MDHTIGLRLPQPRILAPAGGAGQAQASLAPKAPPSPAPPSPAAPSSAQPRPAVYIELFDEELRPGQQHALLAAAPVAQVGNLEPGPRDIGDADPERWQRERVDDVPQVELTLDDFLDIINPLQHIPLVSSLYRSVTGDQITGPARIIGDTLFGGPIAFVASLVNAIIEEASGRDLGANALAALIGDDAGELTAPAVQTAAVAAGAAPDPDAPGDLSGQAALEAYTNDLRDIGRGGAPVPISAGPPAPARLPQAVSATIPAAPGVIQGARAANPVLGSGRSLAGIHPTLSATPQARAPAAPGSAVGSLDTLRPGAAFPDRMREALDKYQAISGARATNDDRRLDEYL